MDELHEQGHPSFASAAEDGIRMKLIPALMGRGAPYDVVRDLPSLHVKLGGPGLINPAWNANDKYCAFLKVCGPLVIVVVEQSHSYGYDTIAAQMLVKSEVHTERRQLVSEQSDGLAPQLDSALTKAVQLAWGKRRFKLADCFAHQ